MTKPENQNLLDLCRKVRTWHIDRNLIDGANDKDQVCKLIQEVGELSDNVCKGNDIRDDIGDILVVLINIAVRNEVSLFECLQIAYDDIKDRKGKMVDGVFVKEADLEDNDEREHYAAMMISMEVDQLNSSPDPE